MIREATISDIPQMQVVRVAVTENALSNPHLVTYEDYVCYLTTRGKGWVFEMGQVVVGFAIADLQDQNIWALFVHPQAEANGIGGQLHDVMLHWYFAQGKEMVWLGTAHHTRAEAFYRKQGWKASGMHGKNEIRFELTAADWKRVKPEKDAAV